MANDDFLTSLFEQYNQQYRGGGNYSDATGETDVSGYPVYKDPFSEYTNQNFNDFFAKQGLYSFDPNAVNPTLLAANGIPNEEALFSWMYGGPGKKVTYTQGGPSLEGDWNPNDPNQPTFGAPGTYSFWKPDAGNVGPWKPYPNLYNPDAQGGTGFLSNFVAPALFNFGMGAIGGLAGGMGPLAQPGATNIFGGTGGLFGGDFFGDLFGGGNTGGGMNMGFDDFGFDDWFNPEGASGGGFDFGEIPMGPDTDWWDLNPAGGVFNPNEAFEAFNFGEIPVDPNANWRGLNPPGNVFKPSQGLFGSGIGLKDVTRGGLGLAKYLYAQNQLGKATEASRSTNDPARAAERARFEAMRANPKAFFESNPTYKALESLITEKARAEGARGGYRGEQDLAKALMEGGARVYADESQLGAMTSGLGFPTSPATADLMYKQAAARANALNPFIDWLNTTSGEAVMKKVENELSNTISSWFV